MWTSLKYSKYFPLREVFKIILIFAEWFQRLIAKYSSPPQYFRKPFVRNACSQSCMPEVKCRNTCRRNHKYKNFNYQLQYKLHS